MCKSNYDTQIIDFHDDHNIGDSEEEENFEDVNETTFTEEEQ